MFELANWSVPNTVVAGFTHRLEGESLAPYDAFNLALHVGDNAEQVLCNRQLLDAALPGEKTWQWLEQVHGTEVAVADDSGVKVADACYSNQAHKVCAVMTADCLPILLASEDGQEIAAIHAGWRSLCYGIIEQTLVQFKAPKEQVLAFFGPAIGAAKFEVGEDVKQAFLSQNCGQKSMAAFQLQANQRYLADLYYLARIRLNALGVCKISGGDLCSFQEAQRFYSYRRDGVTGRMVSFIYRIS